MIASSAPNGSSIGEDGGSAANARARRLLVGADLRKVFRIARCERWDPSPRVAGVPSTRFRTRSDSQFSMVGTRTDVALDCKVRKQAGLLNAVSDTAAQANTVPIAVARPSTRTSPSVGESRSLINLRVVVFLLSRCGRAASGSRRDALADSGHSGARDRWENGRRHFRISMTVPFCAPVLMGEPLLPRRQRQRWILR